MCLRALKALASYHYKETKAGNTGLGSHAAGQTDPNGVFHEGILSRFLRKLLQFLLFEDYRYHHYIQPKSLNKLISLKVYSKFVYRFLITVPT